MFADDDETDEGIANVTRYPCMPSLVALQQMRNRLHLARTGRKLMKWTATASSRELRKLAKEICSSYESFRDDTRSCYMLLARARYFNPHLNAIVLENLGRVAAVTVESGVKSLSGVRVRLFNICEKPVDQYAHFGIEKGGDSIAQAKMAWRDLLKCVILMVQQRTAFVTLEIANKNATKKKNVLDRVVLPRTRSTMAYILDQLDEISREEFYRIKKILANKAKVLQKKMEIKKRLCVHKKVQETCSICRYTDFEQSQKKELIPIVKKVVETKGLQIQKQVQISENICKYDEVIEKLTELNMPLSGTGDEKERNLTKLPTPIPRNIFECVIPCVCDEIFENTQVPKAYTEASRILPECVCNDTENFKEVTKKAAEKQEFEPTLIVTECICDDAAYIEEDRQKTADKEEYVCKHAENIQEITHKAVGGQAFEVSHIATEYKCKHKENIEDTTYKAAEEQPFNDSRMVTKCVCKETESIEDLKDNLQVGNKISPVVMTESNSCSDNCFKDLPKTHDIELGTFETEIVETTKIIRMKNKDGTIIEQKNITTKKVERRNPLQPERVMKEYFDETFIEDKNIDETFTEEMASIESSNVSSKSSRVRINEDYTVGVILVKSGKLRCLRKVESFDMPSPCLMGDPVLRCCLSTSNFFRYTHYNCFNRDSVISVLQNKQNGMSMISAEDEIILPSNENHKNQNMGETSSKYIKINEKICCLTNSDIHLLQSTDNPDKIITKIKSMSSNDFKEQIIRKKITRSMSFNLEDIYRISYSDISSNNCSTNFSTSQLFSISNSVTILS